MEIKKEKEIAHVYVYELITLMDPEKKWVSIDSLKDWLLCNGGTSLALQFSNHCEK